MYQNHGLKVNLYKLLDGVAITEYGTSRYYWIDYD